jgi:xanthine dehydrogenase accessory factor
VAIRLWRAGFPVAVSEVPRPLAVRLGVALAAAIWEGQADIEELRARKVESRQGVLEAWDHEEVPVVVDPDAALAKEIEFLAIIDARMTKQGGQGPVPDHPLVIGLGPGFRVGRDCHVVVETRRGHNLGRVYWYGGAEANTGIPDPVGGRGVERVLRAPIEGEIQAVKRIGDSVRKGEVVACVGDREVRGPFAGVLRGLLHDGLRVSKGMKIGDLDPRGVREYCFRISDKAWAVGGGALEALLASSQFASLGWGLA